MAEISKSDEKKEPHDSLAAWKQAVKGRADTIARPIRRFGFLTKISILRFRYVCGHMAAGFLVSAPLQISMRFLYDHSLTTEEWLNPILHSILLGAILLMPYLMLIPFTQVSWEQMRVPEFKLFELSILRTAAVVSLFYFMMCMVHHAMASDPNSVYALADPRPAWTNLILQTVAWVHLKALTTLFPDFYTNSVKKEDLILRPKSDIFSVPEPAKEAAAAPPSPEPSSAKLPVAPPPGMSP